MMHGKPVVTHRSLLHNAQAELVDHATGFVAGPDDYPACAAFLRRLLDDTQLRNQMGEAARRKALAEFEATAITRRLETIYIKGLVDKGVRLR